MGRRIVMMARTKMHVTLTAILIELLHVTEQFASFLIVSALKMELKYQEDFARLVHQDQNAKMYPR
jgi:hypothetical protein